VVRLGQRGGVVRRRVDRRSLAIAVDLGREESRFDRNDTHAGPDELCVQRLAHPADRLLRGGVHREPAPSREACADSRKVNYHAGALRAHVRQHGLAKVDRAPEVCLPNESRSRFVRLLDRFDEADTCVVHEHVDATSFGGDAGDDIAYRGAIGDVEPANDNGQRFARDHVAKPMIDRWVAHRRMDRVATAAERERGLVTDAGSTSGDQDRCHRRLSARPDSFTLNGRHLIAARAARLRLPAIYPLREFVEAGGLLSYDASLREQFRRAATYVDKILEGARPADLPVEQPTEFELVINLKTVKALGLTIAPSLLA